MKKTHVWRGIDEPRMEIARAEVKDGELRAEGTQIGLVYELRYALEPGRLRAEIAGGPRIEIALEETDFFDLGFSPLFNSLPVLAGLRETTDFVMSFVMVPSLEVSRSEQRYEPRGDGVVRFSSGDFVADITFDDNGFVTYYEKLAERVS